MGIFKRKQLLGQLATVAILVTLVPLLLMGIYFHYQNWIRARKQAKTTLALQTQLISKTLSDRLIDKWSERLAVSDFIQKNNLRKDWLKDFQEVWRISPLPNFATGWDIQRVYRSSSAKQELLSEKRLRQILTNFSRSTRDLWIRFLAESDSSQPHYFLIVKRLSAASAGGSAMVGVLPVSLVLRDVWSSDSAVLKNSRFALFDERRRAVAEAFVI